MPLPHRQRLLSPRKRRSALDRVRVRRLHCQSLESRLALSATGLTGNECVPDLDLSGIPAQSVTVGETWTINLLSNGATATDENADGSATNDVFHFQLDPDVGVDVPTGVSLVDGNGDSVVTNADGAISWTPTSDQVGEHTIMILLMDAGNPVLADSEKLTINVTPEATNTPVVVDLNGAAEGRDYTTTFTAGDGGIPAVGTTAPNELTLTDAEDSLVSSATVTLTNPSDGADEILSVTTTGIPLSWQYDSVSGELSITGTTSVANYETVLRSLTYNNTASTPTTGARTLEFIVNDGTDSAPVTSTINVEIASPNVPPNLASISDQTVVSGDTMEVAITATDANGTDMLTFHLDGDNSPATAELEQIDNTSAVIRWTPSEADGPGPHTFRVIVVDDGSPALSDAEEFATTVRFPAEVDLNGAADGTDYAASFESGDSPVLVVDTMATLTDIDSTALSFVAVLGGATDGDDESLTVSVSGTGAVSEFTGGQLTVSGADSTDELQQILRTLQYDNVAETPTVGDRTVTVTPIDGDLAPVSAVSTVSVALAPATNNGPTITAIDDQEIVNGQAVAIDVQASDPDGDTLTYFLSDSSPGDASITKTSDTTARIDWMPTTVGTFEFGVVALDDGTPPISSTESFSLTVVAPAAGPVVDLNGATDGTGTTTEFVENSDPVMIAESLTVGDPDSTELLSANIRISNLLDGEAESLSVTIQGDAVGSSYSNGLLALAGRADLATYQTILRTLVYENTSDNPNADPRTIAVQVSDGEHFSAEATATVNVSPVEDPPQITVEMMVTGQAGELVTIDVSATDPEGDPVQLSLGAAPDDVAIVDNQDGTGVISWTPNSEGTFSITVVAEDTTHSIQSSQEISVTVSAANQAPIVDLNGDDDGIDWAAEFDKGGGPRSIVTTSVQVSDPDGSDIMSGLVRLTNPLDGDAESLSVITTHTEIIASYDPNGTLTLTGRGTPSQYSAVLESLSYNNTSQSPSPDERIVDITLSDGIDTSPAALIRVSINSTDSDAAAPLAATDEALSEMFLQSGFQP